MLYIKVKGISIPVKKILTVTSLIIALILFAGIAGIAINALKGGLKAHDKTSDALPGTTTTASGSVNTVTSATSDRLTATLPAGTTIQPTTTAKPTAKPTTTTTAKPTAKPTPTPTPTPIPAVTTIIDTKASATKKK
jgi:hypothetical protein